MPNDIRCFESKRVAVGYMVRILRHFLEAENILIGRYLALKDKAKEAEQIRKSVYNILRREEREQRLRKAQEVDR